MSKLSDDLKDEEILIQLAETNDSIFQIIIKTGAGDDMNAILAQEPIFIKNLLVNRYGYKRKKFGKDITLNPYP